MAKKPRVSRKKKSGKLNIITEEFVPARLPAYGEQLENYQTSEYSFNKPEFIGGLYKLAEQRLQAIMETTDKHSAGEAGDHFVRTQEEHARAVHSNDIANNENQVTRIQNAFSMRREAISRKLSTLRENQAKEKAVVDQYKDLRAVFSPKIGPVRINIGIIVTIACMVIDAFLNYSFTQTVLLENANMLILTVLAMSLMSDGSMSALGIFLSRKDSDFMPKPLFYSLCAGFLAAFILSIVGSVMIKVGSMASTFGTVNAAGDFVGKEHYTLAEYGVTLVTSFITTLTGILSFAFSVDKNAYKVSLREQSAVKLRHIDAQIDVLENELALLDKAPDPGIKDAEKRAAAESNIDALIIGLKQHLRKMIAERLDDPNVTDRMSVSGAKLNEKEQPDFDGQTAPQVQPAPTADSSTPVSVNNGTAA